jgi:hypothetical protein
MEHPRHFGTANVIPLIPLREVARIDALIGELDRRAQLLDGHVAVEEQRVGVFDPSTPAYPIIARKLAARRDNLRATIAALEKQVAGLQGRAGKVPV